MKPKPKPAALKAPTARALAAALGPAQAAWDEIVATMHATYPPLVEEWQPTKLEFGSYCRFVQKNRRLLSLIPKTGCFEIIVGLGERATQLALASDLPAATKKLLTETRAYAEGRFVRYDLSSTSDIPVVLRLVEIKTTPK